MGNTSCDLRADSMFLHVLLSEISILAETRRRPPPAPTLHNVHLLKVYVNVHHVVSPQELQKVWKVVSRFTSLSRSSARLCSTYLQISSYLKVKKVLHLSSKLQDCLF